MSVDDDESGGSPLIQFVTFILMDEVYGINVMQVQEVLRVTEIAPVPGAPSYVLGIVNLRGNVVTVIDTRKRFGLPSVEVNDASRVIVIESEKQVVGILVDAVAEVVELSEDQIDVASNVGKEERSSYMQGVDTQDKRLLILVDLNKLLTDEEWQEISMY
ncbi:MAG: chemotaxis protein CheW [Candidatus Thiodiazotropha sp. 6PLUC5]